MLGDVPHPLERGRHAQSAHDDAQVASDGLLAREDLDGQLVERNGLFVDDAVGVDDLFGERDVARAERLGGLLDRGSDELGDLDKAPLDVLEGLMEDFAHGAGPFPGRSDTAPATSAIISAEG